MIYGIGTDIVQIARVAAALTHSERFASKVLGPQELEEYEARKARDPQRALRYLAARFAAKEAFAKAIGTGVRGPMTLPAAQILNDAIGKPQVVCSGPLNEYIREKGLQAQISMSDEADYAVAFCIVSQ